MPYINPDRRVQLDEGELEPSSAGDFAYVYYRNTFNNLLVSRKQGTLNFDHLIREVDGLLRIWLGDPSKISYEESLGALSAAIEVIRNGLVPYENAKRDQNGDVG